MDAKVGANAMSETGKYFRESKKAKPSHLQQRQRYQRHHKNEQMIKKESLQTQFSLPPVVLQFVLTVLGCNKFESGLATIPGSFRKRCGNGALQNPRRHTQRLRSQ